MMDDKTIMSNVLSNVKGMCDLAMHGTIESATPAVHTAFHDTLNDMLCLQNKIYSEMSKKGWYPTEQAETQKIAAAKQKFSSAQA